MAPGIKESLTPPQLETYLLLSNYGPALRAVKRWRSEKEKLIIAGHADGELVREWDTLNRCLKERQRTVKVFEKVRSSGGDEKILQLILRHIWKQLVRTRRYEDLRPHFRSLGWAVLSNAVQYDCEKWFPRGPAESKYNMWRLSFLQEVLTTDGILTCEIAFGIGEEEIGKDLMRKVIAIDSSDQTYSSLIRSAIRARAYAVAADVYAEACISLPIRKRPKCNKAIRALPKHWRLAY